jgi:site-specific DNA-methyltransferase (adenine-specific)
MCDYFIYNDNALNVLDRMILNGTKVDMIFTDPPYRTTARGSYGGTGGILKDELNMKGRVFENNDIDISEWIGKVYEVLKESGHCYIMCNNKNLCHYLTEIKKAKFNIFKTLIWKKDNCITNQYYMDNHEYIIFSRKGRAKKINNCGTKSVLEVANPKNKLHPTEKPTELTDILIENSSKEGEFVLDPFMGVGGCGVSCVKLKRKFIGIEISETYYDIAKLRIEEVI